MSVVEEIFGPLVRAGAAMDYGDSAAEWQSVHAGCAVFPAYHRTFTRAEGGDRFDFLQGMLTNDVRSLAPGGGLLAAFLTDTGKLVSDLRLHCRDSDFLIDCVAWNREPLVERFEKYIIADDVDLSLSDETIPLTVLEGPECGRVVEAVSGVDVTGVEEWQHACFAFRGDDLFVSRVSELGGRGFLFGGAPGVLDDLVEACVSVGGTKAGLAALQMARVEAGVPWVGIDMGEDTLLMEMGFDDAVSRTKGCYLGQEVVERVSARGRVNRNRCVFEIDAEEGDVPMPGEVCHEGSVVGRVTSAVTLPGREHLLGLGLLHRKASRATRLSVRTVRGEVACRVASGRGLG